MTWTATEEKGTFFIFTDIVDGGLVCRLMAPADDPAAIEQMRARARLIVQAEAMRDALKGMLKRPAPSSRQRREIMVEHTPTPWKADCIDTFGYKPRIYGQLDRSGGKLIAEVGNAEDPISAQDEWGANAALIVQSVNAFAALAKHLGREDLDVDLVEMYECLREARGVLAGVADSEMDLSIETIFLRIGNILATFDTVDRADIGHKE